MVQLQSCTILDPTRGSGRVWSENFEGCAGPDGLGTQIWSYKCRLLRISLAFDTAQCCT